MLRKLLIGTMLSTALTAYAAPSFAEEVEVLHWWTSGGEAAALDVLKKNLEAEGVTWKDMPVAGGSGVQAMTALRARVTAGDPPTAVQMLGVVLEVALAGRKDGEITRLRRARAARFTRDGARGIDADVLLGARIAHRYIERVVGFLVQDGIARGIAAETV